MIDKRTKRIRTKLKKVSSRNRLSVFRSNNHIYAQAIDDSKGITLASASTLEKEIVKDQKGRKELASIIGKEIAKRLIEKGIKDVAFDNGGRVTMPSQPSFYAYTSTDYTAEGASVSYTHLTLPTKA